MPSVIRSRSSGCASWIKSSLEEIIKGGTLRKRQPRVQGGGGEGRMRCRPRKRDLGTRTSDTQMEASL